MIDRGEPATRMPLRVRYHECDSQRIVFNANYLVYADMASFELLRTVLGDPDGLAAHGADIVVAESNLRYLASAAYDEELVVLVFVEHLGNTSMTVRFEVDHGEEHIAVIHNRYVFVDQSTMRPARLPEQVRDGFAALVTGPAANAS